MTILNHVPKGFTPRDTQSEVLTEIQNNWDEYDVFVIEAPVAFGKSMVAVTLANWVNSYKLGAALLTPKAILQDQYQRDFPYITSLKGKTKYLCEGCKKDGYKHCSEFYDITGYYRKTCQYPKHVKRAENSSQVILNFHSHLFNGMSRNLYKDILIIDEAHNLTPMLSDLYSFKIWKHKDNYGDRGHTKDDIIMWLEERLKKTRAEIARIKGRYEKKSQLSAHALTQYNKLEALARKYTLLYEGLTGAKERFHISLEEAPYGRSREKHEYINVRPVNMRGIKHGMWPDKSVKKLILLSATIYDKDIESLGIDNRRVKYIKQGSAIPAENRPIVIDSVAPMSFKHITESSMEVCGRIKELAEFHSGKGIIHITYGLRHHFKKYLKGSRYIYHTEEDKEDKYKEFLESSDNKILVACGMSEGIDLNGSDYEWQVIAKTVFPSIGDSLVKFYLDTDPIVYTLEVVRTLVQQSGRICRSPNDFGVTYILDKSFSRFYRGSTKLNDNENIAHYKLFPQYFVEAMQWDKKRK